MFEKYLSENQQGIAMLVGGLILLLFTLGAFSAVLYYIVLLFSLVMIGMGFYKADLYTKIMDLVKKIKKNKSTK